VKYVELRIWLKSGKNAGHFTWRPTYVLLLPGTLNRKNSSLSLSLCLSLSLRVIFCESVRLAEKI
jgi:hypothetical protein